MPLYNIMVKEIQYVSIKEVISRILRHPLLQSVNLETAIQHTIDFIGIVGLPKFYQDKEAIVDIRNYRGLMPCDLISINMVKCKGRTLRSMTDIFHSKNGPINKNQGNEATFKTQHNIIFTSFERGEIEISYKAIPVDEDGYPLLPDNANFLKALEEYIKLEVFTILFDLNKISNAVLQNQQQRYYWRVAQVQSEFTIPSISEMESITRMFNTLIPRQTEFDNGFKHLGDREYIKNH